jgi:hypothetical protein
MAVSTLSPPGHLTRSTSSSGSSIVAGRAMDETTANNEEMKRAAIQLALTRVPSLGASVQPGSLSSMANADYDTLIGSLSRDDRNFFGMFAHHDIRHLSLAYLWIMDFVQIAQTSRAGRALIVYHLTRTYQLTHCATPQVPTTWFTLPRHLKSIYMETPNPYWPPPPVDLMGNLIINNRATLRTFALAGSHYRQVYFGGGSTTIIKALTGCRQLRCIALPNVMPKDVIVPMAQKQEWSDAVVAMIATTPELEVLDFECSHVLTAASLEKILAMSTSY